MSNFLTRMRNAFIRQPTQSVAKAGPVYLPLSGGWLSGDAAQYMNSWVDHVRTVYPVDAEHIINYRAHRVQRPHEKINHGLVLGGAPGVGKDTLIEPVKRA